MKSPTPRTSTAVLRNLGRWHVAALGMFEETRPMVPEFSAVFEDLMAAWKAVQEAEDALLVPRMTLALVEIDVDAALRRLDGACKVVDGAKGGPTAKALMPNGLTPEVAAAGQRQLKALDAILTRAERRNLVAHEKLAAVFAELRAVRDRLEAALAARTAAYGVVAQARVTETMAREDFCTAYSKDAGLIRSIYPKDTARREFFFDTFGSTPSASGDDAEDEEPAEDEGPTPGA